MSERTETNQLFQDGIVTFAQKALGRGHTDFIASPLISQLLRAARLPVQSFRSFGLASNISDGLSFHTIELAIRGPQNEDEERIFANNRIPNIRLIAAEEDTIKRIDGLLLLTVACAARKPVAPKHLWHNELEKAVSSVWLARTLVYYSNREEQLATIREEEALKL
ncbi:MAG: hypothetical protein A2751_02790 [Candidatus Doudnabacteria bacterium RIFCSPHIGHO2_01_FULL_46_14]|uniref:Uncharacterized protein n=1 Tax=Candidatus Doudnabacteria bacterium RIFCSPHIGHO2_01_FULL_46_14 TaxID=1817824 RepID=A0A1F5NJX0_9BACT|nr:MAG: hypothetical protein A2751_02790 [Candidatus Doudnabacteria bacterium RIFCSPHIGHO2_01_FULL_46_14]